MQRIGILILTSVILFGLFYAFLSVVSFDSWCAKKGGLLISTNNGQVCISETVIIKR